MAMDGLATALIAAVDGHLGTSLAVNANRQISRRTVVDGDRRFAAFARRYSLRPDNGCFLDLRAARSAGCRLTSE
jgi:hypothetical protein